jgi:hypothetical protein
MMTGLEISPRISATGDPIAYAARCPSLSSPFRGYGRVLPYAGEGVARGISFQTVSCVLSITHVMK